mgnify:FL=1
MTRLYRAFACFCLFSLLAYAVSAQDTSIAFGPERARWFRIAQEVQPVLQQTVVEPVGLVRPVRDSSAFQGWRMEPAGDMQQFYDMTYKRGTPSVIVDFGRHVTGYFSFCIASIFCSKPSELMVAMSWDNAGYQGINFSGSVPL